MSQRVVSRLFLLALLVLLPVAVGGERSLGQQWQSRLALPDFTMEVDRHTPLHASGTILPPRLTQDLTLRPTANPVIVPWTVVVPAGVTLTVTAGTQIFVHELAGLDIYGTLESIGDEEQRVVFVSNEQHPLNQTWTGLTFRPGSQGNVSWSRIAQASPALTCLSGSTVAVRDSSFIQSSLGLFTAGATCTMHSSHVAQVRDGVTAIGTDPGLNQTSISARHHHVRTLQVAPN